MIRHSFPLKHASVGFGLGLATLQPQFVAAGLALVSVLWAAFFAVRTAWRHWPGLIDFLALAGDFLMLLFIISLLLGGLWVLPLLWPA